MQVRHYVLGAALLAQLLPCTLQAQTSERADKPEWTQREITRNKATARRVYEEGLSRGRFEVPYTRDFIGHGGGTATFTHEDGIKEAKGWRQAFPDLKVNVDRVVAEGDLVTVSWTARGTNTAAGQGIPATGKSVQTSGITMFRFADGAIAEEWTAGDALGLLRQLGLLPTPPARVAQGQ